MIITFTIKDDIHARLVDYCLRHSLDINDCVNDILEKFIEKHNQAAKSSETEELERQDWNKRFLELRAISTLEVGDVTLKREDIYNR